MLNTQNIIFSLIVVGLIVAGVWYFFFYEGTPADEDSGLGTAMEGSIGELPETVAVVNGEEIARAEFETAESQFAAQQGATLSALDVQTRIQVREQVLNQLISRTLISQAAEASGTAVPAAQIDAQIESVTGQFESEEAYLAELDAQGLTEAELRSQIEAELLGQIYLEGTLDYESIAVTEEEVQSTYEQVAASGGQVPPLAEVREQVEQLVIQQKQQTLVAAHVDELRAEADIETFI